MAVGLSFTTSEYTSHFELYSFKVTGVRMSKPTKLLQKTDNVTTVEYLEESSANLRRELVTIPKGQPVDVTMLIDCKHWKRMSYSNLKIIVDKQIKRAEQYIQNKKNMTVVPIIVTLYKEETSFVNGTPIVPIFQFSSFIDEFYGNLEYMNTIER